MSLSVEEFVVEVISDLSALNHVTDHVLEGLLVDLVVGDDVFLTL